MGINKRLIYLLLSILPPLLTFCSRNNGSLTICFTGDVLLDRGVRKKIERVGVDSLFSDARPLFLSSDAVVINLENPVTKRINPLNKKYVFRAEPEWMPALRRQGVTHAALANNHTIDQGREGITDTYNNLAASGIVPIGYGINQQEACKPCLIEKNGVKAALFNSVLLSADDRELPDDEIGICQASIEEIASNIKAFKDSRRGYHAVAILHWGIEHAADPTPRQRADARKLADAGADAVIGHHPHVIQADETYNGTPIFYSLGNFVFDQRQDDGAAGLAVILTFTRAGERRSRSDSRGFRCSGGDFYIAGGRRRPAGRRFFFDISYAAVDFANPKYYFNGYETSLFRLRLFQTLYKLILTDSPVIAGLTRNPFDSQGDCGSSPQ